MTDTADVTDDITDVAEAFEPDGSRRRLIFLLLLGAVGAGALLYLFLLQPLLAAEEVVAEPVVPAAAGAAAAVEDDGAPEPSDIEAVVPGDPDAEEPPAAVTETYISGALRSPFQQLVADGAGTGTATTEALTATTGTTTTATTTTATAPTATATTETATTGTTATAAPPVAQVGTALVRLVGVTKSDGVTRAHVTVDEQGHMVAAGETFASRYRLDSITGDCATFSVGDRRMNLCSGEQIRK